jgi:glutamine amidotransferase
MVGGLPSWATAISRSTRNRCPQRAARFAQLSAAICTDLLIGHVRKARLPPVNTLANTHPFKHACCGREWVFVHNGLVPEAIEIAQRHPRPPGTPAGETDSEYAFCHLLENISRHFHEPSAAGREPWFDALPTLSGLIAAHGKFTT